MSKEEQPDKRIYDKVIKFTNKFLSYDFKSYVWSMKPKSSNQKMPAPTKTEMEILKILWHYGPSTVRFIHDILNERKKKADMVIYTSTLKSMQMMKEKGLLERDDSQMKHVYIAAEEKKFKAGLLNKFLENIYDGSASELMSALLGNNKTSENEIKEMKKLLDKLEKKK